MKKKEKKRQKREERQKERQDAKTAEASDMVSTARLVNPINLCHNLGTIRGRVLVLY